MLRGIFKLEKDANEIQCHKLTWCFAMPGENRPTSFSAEPGSNHKLIELERFDETDAIEVIGKSKGLTYQDSVRRWIKSVVLNSPSPEAITALKSLRRLESLTLGVANEHVVQELSGHLALKQLRFKCNVSAEVIAELAASLPRLEKLDILCTEFTDAHGTAIAQSKSLKELCLSNVAGDYRGFKHLKNSSIATLRFDMSEFPLANVELIGSKLAKLRIMKFYECNFSSEELVPINHLKQIDSVELVYCEIDSDGGEYLKTLPNLSKLKINYQPPYSCASYDNR